MVSQLGTIGEAVLGKLDYEAALEQYSQALRSGKKINLVKIFNDVDGAIKSGEAKVYDNEDMLDMIVEEIRRQSKF